MLQIDDEGNSYDDGVYEPDYGDVVTIDDPVVDDREPGWDTFPTEPPAPPVDDREPGWDTFPTEPPAPAGDGWTDADEVGNKYKYDSSGKLVFQGSDGKTYSWNDAKRAFTDATGNIAGNSPGFLGLAKKLFVNADGTLKPNVAGAIGGGLLGAMGVFQPKTEKVGYQGGLKDLVAQRTMATAPVAGRRPGAGGTNYGGDVQYTERSANAAAPAAPVQTVRADTTAGGNPWAGKMKRGFATTVDQQSQDTPAATAVDLPGLLASAQGVLKNKLGEKTAQPARPPGMMNIEGDDWNSASTGGNTGTSNPAAEQAAIDYSKKIRDQINNVQTYGAVVGKGAGTGIPNQPDTYDAYTNPASPGITGIANLLGSTKPQSSGVVDYSDFGEPTADELAKDEALRKQADASERSSSKGVFVEAPTPPQPVNAAHGGLMGLAHGGRYLQGNTDGMADKLRTSIDGKQPAALSHGEFVVPADVVSHLGNGNSDAGAKKLYSMMDKIRQARTGTKKQGKKINPDKFMPGGLAAAYAAGGSVRKFTAGGATDLTSVPTGTTGVDQTLATWTGNYAPNMLAKTEALTNAPMPQYSGPLTAGASDLQNQAFAGASENAAAGYDPTKFTSGTFNTQTAQQYMNPYLQASLDPQMKELQRQAQIANIGDNAALTRGGAFGGGRQAVLMGEQNRNLLDKSSALLSSGYNTAYDKAMAQFNADQNRGLDTQKASEASRQYGADYGLKSLNQLNEMGATQRGIESEGLAADKKAFEDARNAPYEQLKFQSQMLNGLPIQATNYTSALPSTAQQVLSGAGGVAGLLGTKTSYTMDDVTAAMRKLGFNV